MRNELGEGKKKMCSMLASSTIPTTTDHQKGWEEILVRDEESKQHVLDPLDTTASLKGLEVPTQECL